MSAIAGRLAAEVAELFAAHGLPVDPGAARSPLCDRIVMISTHGHWGDPPPAGATDTGGQTLYVLEVSREWARADRKVLILARWFAPEPRVERLDENLWLLRIAAGGDRFVRKEDIYPLAPQLAEYATAVAERFGARAVMGHYADGMLMAAEVAARLSLPFVAMPHSLALTKIRGLGLDDGDAATWFDERYRFALRHECELAALAQADLVIGCMPGQLDSLDRRSRRDVVAPGVAPVFFQAAGGALDPDVPARFGLVPGRYLVATSRMAESKNPAGAVSVLGELRARGAADAVLALVGGTLDPRQPEEVAVERSIRLAMAEHGLTDEHVVRIPAQPWPVLAQLLAQSRFYLAMQRFEPFGMGVAEALAAGAPVLVSERAGIAMVIDATQTAAEPCALIVDPDDPRRAAIRLQAALDAPAELERMRETGRRLARRSFSWPHAALRLASRLDGLVALDARARLRRSAGHHRLTAAWRGDSPRVARHHQRTAGELVPWLLRSERAAVRSGSRLVAAIGGESGAGKTETAHCLRVALRRHGLAVALVPGDVFFRLPPAANHEARVRAAREGRLARVLGPPVEVDLDALDRVLAAAADPRTTVIHCPADCRALPGRRYSQVPIDLTGCRIVLVDLTYAMLLDSPALRIFLESGHDERLSSIRARNLARDPDQDLALVMEVLAIEHRLIAPTAGRAHLTVDRDGRLRETCSPERSALAPLR